MAKTPERRREDPVSLTKRLEASRESGRLSNEQLKYCLAALIDPDHPLRNATHWHLALRNRAWGPKDTDRWRYVLCIHVRGRWDPHSNEVVERKLTWVISDVEKEAIPAFAKLEVRPCQGGGTVTREEKMRIMSNLTFSG